MTFADMALLNLAPMGRATVLSTRLVDAKNPADKALLIADGQFPAHFTQPLRRWLALVLARCGSRRGILRLCLGRWRWRCPTLPWQASLMHLCRPSPLAQLPLCGKKL